MPDLCTVPIRSTRWRGLFVIVLALGGGLRAQQPEAAGYPVDPVAAAGMTSGLPNGITSRQAEMMQVRTAAQGAQGEAAAASLARSADQSIEERNREVALQTARTNKTIKEEMRNRLRFERAAAAQKKVSAHDMSTWQQNGGVRVERNVPNAFINSIIAEEEEAAARASASGGQRKRVSLFGNGSGSSSGEGGGFLDAIRPPAIRLPRLPFTGGGRDRDAEVAASEPRPSDNSEPVFAQQGASSRASAPASAPTPAKPGVVPMISGAALVDGRAPAQSADRTPSAPQRVSAADRTPEPSEAGRKKPGLFSAFASGGSKEEEEELVPSSSNESRGGGFFGLGKKKAPAHVVPGIDASLFPEGAVDQTPRGGRLTGTATARDVAADASADPSSTGSFALPGQTVEREEKAKGRGGFALPKPNLSLPSVPNLARASSPGGGATSLGSYVVSSTAQFMAYGADPMQSEIRAIPAGTAVMVTKPGEQWSGVRLSDGTEGIVQNKNLRPSSGGGGGGASGGEFATGQ